MTDYQEDMDPETTAAVAVESESEDDFEIDEALLVESSGVKIYYSGGEAIGIPVRNNFVSHTKLEPENLLFMPVDIVEPTDSRRQSKYFIKIFGVLQDGEKVEVHVVNIPVFFDVLVPAVAAVTDGTAAAEFGTKLHMMLIEELSDLGSDGLRIEDVYAFPIRGFNAERRLYKRVFTNNLAQRKKVLAAAIAAGHETASNDQSSYYRKAARENNLPLTQWALLRKYVIANVRSTHCSYVFEVDYVDYCAADCYEKDRTMIMTWDIETYSKRGRQFVPDGREPEDECFMLCMTFHWKDVETPLLQVCLVDVETSPDPRWTTVVCKTPENILRAFALCWHNMKPDIVVGFNDSNYDWPFVVEKMMHYKMLEWAHSRMSAEFRFKNTDANVYKFQYGGGTGKRIKITAEETFESKFLRVPGTVAIDIRVCYKKLYPKSETQKASSLKFYLDLCKLPTKFDMPISKMWNYYEQARRSAAGAAGEASAAAAAEFMRHVANYCVIDAFRCQQLQIKRDIVNDYRTTSSLAYISLADSHYYAGGMRVCNLLNAEAFKRGILCNSITKQSVESGKYPGAYVFPPEKGLVPDPGRIIELEAAIKARNVDRTRVAFAALAGDRPVTGLDFSSLYPSLIMTYNLSPEKMVLTVQEAAHWAAKGYKVHKIEFPYNGRTVNGWTIMHQNRQEDIGLYPQVLISLKNCRNQLKKQMTMLGKEKELLNLAISNGGKQCTSISDQIEAFGDEDRAKLAKYVGESDTKILDEFDKLCFNWSCANTKQNAVKVYMNTFYGEAGNERSAFFLLELAGGVTSMGQYNIQMVAKFVESQGFKIKYGDTDSLYLVAPNATFAACDTKFARGTITKREWMTEMVQLTMAALNDIRDKVNERLFLDNGSKYLSMAYEEVLYPAVFLGKKKYFGIAHVEKINFDSPDIFIRGIDVIKQGQAGMSRTIGYKIMHEAVSIDNTRTMRTIVEDTLRDAIERPSQWKYEDFIKTGAWKPSLNSCAAPNCKKFGLYLEPGALASSACERHASPAAVLLEHYDSRTWVPVKGNKMIMQFIHRMYTRKRATGANMHLPEIGERFRYVDVKVGDMFTLRGCKIAAKKGDVMEFADSATIEQVDISSYLKHVTGICARFIHTDDQTISDAAAQAAAKTELDGFIKSVGGTSDITSRERGAAYRRAYSQAEKSIVAKLMTTAGKNTVSLLHGAEINFDLLAHSEEEKIMEEIKNLIKKNVDAQSAEAEAKILKQLVAEKDFAYDAEFERFVTREYLRGIDGINQKIASLLPYVIDIATRYELSIQNVINSYRDAAISGATCAVQTFDEKVITPDDIKVITRLHELVRDNGQLSIILNNQRLTLLCKQKLRRRKIGVVEAPSAL